MIAWRQEPPCPAPALLPPDNLFESSGQEVKSMQFNEPDFDGLCWHDCHIWGMSFRCGDPAKDDWTSELAMDIDFICEWRCADENARFRVAPALLTFHGVQSLAIDVRWEESCLAYPLSIAQIARETTSVSALVFGERNWRWQIDLNWPEQGKIMFSAFGFSQLLRSEPVATDEQFLDFAQRRKLLGD